MKTKSFLSASCCLLLTPLFCGAQVLTDFESFAAPGANGGIMFRTPNVSGTTAPKIEAAPSTLISQVRNAGIPAGNANVGLNALYASWNFVDAGQGPLWVRFTTDSASNPLGRPTITLAAGTALQFDLWTDHALYISALIRETETAAAFGANGGATGSIEYVGGNPSAASGNRGTLVPANTWTTVLIHFQNPSLSPVFGFTGNGVLDPGADGKGVLESLGLAFDDVVENRNGDINLWVDNFAVVTVPEPGVTAMLGLGLTGLIAFRRMRK